MQVRTFLEMCQQLMRDAGISGTITNTEGNAGERQRVVDWVARATTEIEGMWFNWNFLHSFYSLATIEGVSDYPPPPDLNMWDRETFSIVEREQQLGFIDWNEKRTDATDPVEGDPYMVTILPTQALRFYDTPTSILTIATQYYKTATVLIENADEPLIPLQFRDIVVYKALQYYANYESADESKLAGIEQIEPRLRQLQSRELPANQNSGSINTGTMIQVVAPGATAEDFY